MFQQIAFQRLIAGLVHPNEGLVYTPPFARTLAVPDQPVVFPGTLLHNMRFALDGLPAERFAASGLPSDNDVMAISAALGLEPQLVDTMRDHQPVHLKGAGYELEVQDTAIITLTRSLACLP